MTIIGFNFSKLLAFQKKPAKGSLKVGTNVKLENVEKTNLSFDDKRGALKASFVYTVSYDPDIGSVELEGDVLFMQDKKVVEELLDMWSKKKELPKKLMASLVNHIMQKCMLQSLILTKDVGLPPPMPLPKVKSSSVKAPADNGQVSPSAVEKKD